MYMSILCVSLGECVYKYMVGLCGKCVCLSECISVCTYVVARVSV